MKTTCAGFKLIYVIVEAGRGSHIMKAAHHAGSEGSTAYFARGTSIHEHGKFLGMPIEPEKEVVMILVPDSQLDHVFQGVVEGGNLETPGKGIAFVVDVYQVAGICHWKTEEE